MKINSKLIILFVLILTLATTACGIVPFAPRLVRGDGNVVEENRAVDNFDQIDFRGIGNLFVEIGDEASLTVEMEENLLQYLETYNQGDRLVIEIEDGININPTEPVTFYLTVPSLQRVDVSGLGNVELPVIEAERFTVDISGAGDVEIEGIYADSLRISMSGLGNFRIDEGEVFSQDVEISGSGQYEARDLESSEANIEISGLGSATVKVSDYLDVSISGAGGVDYYGDPEIDKSISGLGDLDHLGSD
jgi:hypothetical protein